MPDKSFYVALMFLAGAGIVSITAIVIGGAWYLASHLSITWVP